MLLFRQLTAHRAYVLRRGAVECAAAGAAYLGRWFEAAARASVRLYPYSPRPHLALAAHASRRGAAAEARRHRERAREVGRNSRDISILTTLLQNLVWRRRAGDRGGIPEALANRVRAGHWAAASELATALRGPVGARVDALAHVAIAALAADQLDCAKRLLTRAIELDRGRPDLWKALGTLEERRGDARAARDHLERAWALDSVDTEVLIALGDLATEDAPERARSFWWRALDRGRRDASLFERLERLEKRRAVGEEATVGTVTLPPETTLELGAESEIELRAEAQGGDAILYVLEPFGAGVACEPRGRVTVCEGTSRTALRIRATRPDTVNRGRPWVIECVLWGAGSVLGRAEIAVAVPDREPGRILYLITEDHELYDERETTSAGEARITLYDKSRLAEQIANQRGAAWTHMVDMGSQALVGWAAEQSAHPEWRETAERCREHLIDAVATGNDLGLHIHAFHDPQSVGFCHGFDATSDRVTTSPAFLETPVLERGFWSRAYEALGDVEVPGTRAWATWRGIGFLESLGRLGDARYRTTLFRAGSFDFGNDARERARSLMLLRRLGVLADSDVPKPRLYDRLPDVVAYPVSGDIRTPETELDRMRLLEIRPEFNIESDFLSDSGVLNRYVDRRVEALTEPGRGQTAAGVHIICCITHDKFINWRMERAWDSLDPKYGDWDTIARHLDHISSRHPAVRRATACEAVTEWYDYYAPELMTWREEEVIVTGPPGADEEVYRYPLRLLGRGICVSPQQPRWVTTLVPAWLQDRIRDVWVERDRQRWPARAFPAGPLSLEFSVDDRDAAWSLVVSADPGAGVTAQRDPDGAVRVRAALPYRRASLEIPDGFAADGRARWVRGVRLDPDGEFFSARIPAADLADAPEAQ